MTGENGRPPCRRCLLRDMEEQESLYQSVLRLRRAMTEKERAVEGEYKRRLDICRECAFLDRAVCMQCGCYAEVRALKRGARCPVGRW